jgi:putative transposase
VGKKGLGTIFFEDRRWSSLWRRTYGESAGQGRLSERPVPRPQQWVTWVNEPQTPQELETLRRCVRRGQPFGSESWEQRMVTRLGLESTVRPRRRPKKTKVPDTFSLWMR